MRAVGPQSVDAGAAAALWNVSADQVPASDLDRLANDVPKLGSMLMLSR
jgi:hypothetical protein